MYDGLECVTGQREEKHNGLRDTVKALTVWYNFSKTELKGRISVTSLFKMGKLEMVILEMTSFPNETEFKKMSDMFIIR